MSQCGILEYITQSGSGLFLTNKQVFSSSCVKKFAEDMVQNAFPHPVSFQLLGAKWAFFSIHLPKLI